MTEREGRLPLSGKILIKHNLSGNKYGKYIIRQSLEDRITNFLKNDHENYQVISGLGGMGKSSLIYSVLSKVIVGEITLGKSVDSIIWVTDSYKPGDLDLDKLLDEIIVVYGTADSTNSTQAFTGSKQGKKDIARKHLNLGGNRMSILVVDNFETVKDEELRHFIFQLPQSCKVILTSKISRDACMQNGVISLQNAQCINDFPIPKFSKEEWRSLFAEICSTEGRIKEWADRFNQDQINQIVDMIYAELDGIPFPFERILTRIAERKLTDTARMKKLINTAIQGQDGYERMISYSWEQLERNSKAVLIAAVLNGFSSFLDFKKISAITDLESFDDENSPEIGTPLDNAVQECLNHKLIDDDIVGCVSKYYVPAIICRYIINKILNERSVKEAFNDVIVNWIQYYKERTDKVGMCFNNTEVMKSFDSVNQREALEFVLDYCYRNELYKDYVRISDNMRYFFYTRSIWEVGDKCVHIKRAKAAEKCGDFLAELEAYIYYINIASKYRQFDNVDDYLQRIEEIIEAYGIKAKCPESYFRYKHAMGLYYFHHDDYARASKIWEEILLPADDIITTSIHDVDAATRWYNKCIMKQAIQSNKIDDGLTDRVKGLLDVARKHKFERAIIDYTLMLVRIYAQSRRTDECQALLSSEEVINLINKSNDVLYKAHYYLWCAYVSCGDEKIQMIEKAKSLVKANSLIKIIQSEIAVFGEEFCSIFEG